MKPESPTVVAGRLGLRHKCNGKALSLDELLDLAVSMYWKRRAQKRDAA